MNSIFDIFVHMKQVFLITLSFLLVCSIFGQDVHYFTSGLTIPAVSRYGREAVSIDQIAYKLYTNTLATPVAGDSFGIDQRGQAIRWQAVTADSLKRMRGRGGFGGGGYIYLNYKSPRNQNALLHIQGNSSVFFNKEAHTGDPYSSGWLYIPVHLKKGLNEFYVRGGNIVAKLFFSPRPVMLNVEDPTLPFIVPGQPSTELLGAVVIINNSTNRLSNLKIQSDLRGNKMMTDVPSIPPMSTRKVMFRFNGEGTGQPGKHNCTLQLTQKGRLVDEKSISIEAVAHGDKYSNTFISAIDSSVQYYAVTPQTPGIKENAALFLSVHGAGVEAIGQARAYQSKDWGTLVAATNRRPRGFNWEDWGRIDALEVLEIARKKFKPDPQQIYLTGHSMGGHGTWFLGATYPDKWAAIGPCAGYPTLKEYGSADGLIPASSTSPTEQLLLRSSNQSDVLKLTSNYNPLGVYIFHGDADRVVPVRYARQMKKLLADFHADISYYEYPGGEHWFGDQSVDWKPMFDYFKWHKREADSSINTIDFMTSNPGISASYRWATIHQQLQPLEYSRIQLRRNRQANTITGSTDNVRLLKLDLGDFNSNAVLKITLDSLNTIEYSRKVMDSTLFLQREKNLWVVSQQPDVSEKGPHRYGTFKDPFNHNMVFIYGTTGTRDENEWSFNKARYDAETWYYRGNGAVEIIPDKEFSEEKYSGRNVILFGNATTNSVYNRLLVDCPIRVDRNAVKVGAQTWEGDDFGAYFVWPLKGSLNNSVGVIGGTGFKGMNAATPNQYFAGASGFPDFMIFQLSMLTSGVGGIRAAGFFDNEWKLDEKNISINNN